MTLMYSVRGNHGTFPPQFRLGDSGPWVKRLQEDLRGAGFRPGVADGRFDQATLGAVYAFQKVHGLDRDGVFRDEHWALLDADIELPAPSDVPDRVEVDLAKQVLFLVKNDHVAGGTADLVGKRRNLSRLERVSGTSQNTGRRLLVLQAGRRVAHLLPGRFVPSVLLPRGIRYPRLEKRPPVPASHGCVGSSSTTWTI